LDLLFGSYSTFGRYLRLIKINSLESLIFSKLSGVFILSSFPNYILWLIITFFLYLLKGI